MQITWGGILILFIIALLVVAIIVVRRLIKGEPLPFNNVSFRSLGNLTPSKIKANVKNQKPNTDIILCLNIYSDKIIGEHMLKASVCKDADIWEYGSKKYLLQINDKGSWKRLDLPDVIAYPPERLARMMGCEPLRKLKSLKFTWYEKVAPFAPVVAILIGAFLFMVVL